MCVPLEGSVPRYRYRDSRVPVSSLVRCKSFDNKVSNTFEELKERDEELEERGEGNGGKGKS